MITFQETRHASTFYTNRCYIKRNSCPGQPHTYAIYILVELSTYFFPVWTVFLVLRLPLTRNSLRSAACLATLPRGMLSRVCDLIKLSWSLVLFTGPLLGAPLITSVISIQLNNIFNSAQKHMPEVLNPRLHTLHIYSTDATHITCNPR